MSFGRPDVATIDEAAEHLFMSPQRFKQLQKAGVIPRFPPMELDLDICREAYIEHLRMEKGGRGRDPDSGPSKPAGQLNLEQEKAKVARRQSEKLDLELARHARRAGERLRDSAWRWRRRTRS